MDKLLKVIAEQNEEAECCFQLKRIGDALEEILRLVKKDQEQMQRYKEETTERWEHKPNEKN